MKDHKWFVKSRKALRWGRVGRHLSKVQVTYSGSPDSEVVASYIEKFDYHPEKRNQIRQKYENLINNAS